MYYPAVAALEPDEIRLLCDEYLQNNYIDPSDCERLGVKRGLRNADGTGVLAGLTNVSNVVGYDTTPDGKIVPIPGRLIYRGIDIDTLVKEADEHDRFMFEETVWLLLFGSLPDRELLQRFCKLLDDHRELPRGFADDMIMNSPSPNIMNKMARSVLAMYSYDEQAEDRSLANILRQSDQPHRRASHHDGQRLPDQAARLRPGKHVLPSAHRGPEHGRAHSFHLPSRPEIHPRGSAAARPLPAGPRRPRRRQLLHLHLPRAVLLRY